MPESSSLDNILAEARKLTEAYKWFEASKIYKDALASLIQRATLPRRPGSQAS